MIKYALIKCIICICSISFLSCGTQAEQDDKEANVQQFDFKQTPINWIGMWQKRESKRELVSSVIRQFEIENQHIQVNYKFKEQIDKEFDDKYILEDSIISMIKTGKYAWDIVSVTRRVYENIAIKLNDPEWGKKYLVDFGEYDWFRERHIEDVLNETSIPEGYGGIYAGPLISGRNYGLWYNEKLAAKLGLNIKQIGMTYDDFLGYCKVVHQYNQTAQEPITFMPNRKINSQITDIFNNLVLSDMGNLSDELPDLKVVERALNRALLALEQLSEFNPINEAVNVDKNFVFNLNGQVLFSVKPSSWYNQCESTDAEKSLDLVPAELPCFENSSSLYPGTYQSVWAVFKFSPHKEQAVELMKYFSSNDVAERWLSTTYNPTGLKVKLKSSDFAQNKIEVFNTYIENKYGHNLKVFKLGEILFGNGDLTIEPRKVMIGELTAEEYYESILKQL